MKLKFTKVYYFVILALIVTIVIFVIFSGNVPWTAAGMHEPLRNVDKDAYTGSLLGFKESAVIK